MCDSLMQALEVTPQRCSSHWHHSEICAFEFSKFFIKIIFYNFLPDEFMFRYIKEKNPSLMRSTRMYSVNNSKQGHDRQWMS